jgi:hypothetical protein
LNKRTSINSIPTIHKEKEMADFRKWLYAFAVVALLAGLTVPASAQPGTFQTCVGGAVNPLVRAEGYADLSGDITITCNGGPTTAATVPIPSVTITVSMNTTITSKITATGFNPAFNEALLLVDEPGLVNPILNCGNSPAGAPYDPVAGAGVCTIISDGTTAHAYNGTSGHPNVFQGRQVNNSNSQIISFTVPLDGGSHTLRITNVRANAVQISGGRISSGNFGTTLIFQSVVTFNSPNSVNAQVFNVTNGTIRNGLDSVTGTGAGPYLQCIFTTATTEPGGTVTLVEGYQSAWKTRNWALIDSSLGGNGTFAGTSDWKYAGTTNDPANDAVQNVPSSFYNTESGFMFPPGAQVPTINPPQGISTLVGTSPAGSAFVSSGVNTGIASAGTVTQGTRFAVNFANIPAGTTISVPGSVPLVNTTSGGLSQTGVIVAVGSTDANGAGGTVGTGGTITSGTNFTVIYEVLFADPLVTESATITVTANVAAFNGTNPQVGVTTTATAGFAPWYTNVAGNAAGCPLQLIATPLSGGCPSGSAPTYGLGPIPRFVTGFLPSPAINLFSFSRCACDLLFPYVVGDSTLATSIVIANTSMDPSNMPTPATGVGFTASQQSGTVTFWFFGTTDISLTPTQTVGPSAVVPPITSLPVPAGSYTALIIAPGSNTGAAGELALQAAANSGIKNPPIPNSFAGYVIAQSQFQYCHGVASISTPGIPLTNGSGLSPQTYVGLVMDKATELQRTNQVFSDRLEN